MDTDTCTEDWRVSYSLDGPVLTTKLKENYMPSDISDVWYRRPKALEPPDGTDRNDKSHIAAEWSEALEGVLAHIPADRWMNHPARIATASHKLDQLSRAATHSLSVPQTLVTQDPEEMCRFWKTCDGKVIVKPLALGYIERELPDADSVIYTNIVSESDLDKLDTLHRCPTLFQQMVEKVLDVRITVVDEHVVPIAMRSTVPGEKGIDIRRRNMENVEYSSIQLPDSVRNSILSLLKGYGLRFAAVDMGISDQGEWFFFEINPNGQWAWLDLAGGFDIAAAFVESFKPFGKGK